MAALHGDVALGTGYPGTPTTQILNYFDGIGGKSQWASTEDVAFAVGIGAAYGGARALMIMKQVGLKLAADQRANQSLACRKKKMMPAETSKRAQRRLPEKRS